MKKRKKNEAIIIDVVIKLFTTIKIRKVKIGDAPVVAKVYLLKFSKTFNSLTLFSSNNAKHIFCKGLKDKDINNNEIKYIG